MKFEHKLFSSHLLIQELHEDLGVKSTLKDSSHGHGAKDTDLVEGLSGAKVREEVVGRGASGQG